MDAFWQDVRYGLRMLAKTPALTAMVVVTLGLGIGANTALFSVVNAILLRPLPVPQAQQIVVLANSHEENKDPHNISYLDFQDYRKNSDAFSDMSAFLLGFVGITTEGHAERAVISYVTSSYFSLLGIQPQYGRFILPGEGDQPGAAPVLVLGNAYWKRRFGGDPSAVGKIVAVNGQPFTVIGVVPENFHGTYTLVEMEAYLPIGMTSLDSSYKDTYTLRDSHDAHVFGRLKPGVSTQQAQASLAVIAAQLAKQYPATNKTNQMYVFPETSARPEANSAKQTPLLATVFMGLVVLVLLVACVNVANLLLARATVREKELAIRTALGAGRLRIMRQLLTESIVLAFLGGAMGALTGIWAGRFLSAIHLPGDLPIKFDFSLDWRVFLYIAALALATGVLVGLVPALRSARSSVYDTLREGGRAPSGGGGSHRMRNALVVAQVAGSMLLLIAAGLFLRSLGNARNVDFGFRADHLLTMSMDPSQEGFNAERSKSFYRELERHVRALPGVQSASVSFSVPLGYNNQSAYVHAEGQAVEPGQRGPDAGFNKVGSDYFETMRVPILHGRAVGEQDIEASPRVAVVNETLARRLWPDQDPLGKRFFNNDQADKPMEVVGVSRDGKYGWMFEDPRSYYFVPMTQDFSTLHALEIRTLGPPENMRLTVEKEIRALDPNLPLYDVLTMEQSMQGGNGLFLLNIGAAFAAALGGLGLVLALVGVYGVVAYASSQRTHEIGIRMALGAQRDDVLKMILRQGFGLVLAGIALGLLAAFGLSRFIANMLFNMKPADPLTFATVALFLAAVALIACFIPAQRATHVDPMIALRYE
jgi:predicted permease